MGILSPYSGDLEGDALARYTVPHIPPSNPYIKQRDAENGTERVLVPPAPSVSSRKLVRPLMEARSEATRALWSFLVDSKFLRGLVTAKMRGEPWMQVAPAT